MTTITADTTAIRPFRIEVPEDCWARAQQAQPVGTGLTP